MAVAAMEATGQLQPEGAAPLRAPEQHSRASSLVNKPYDFVLMVRWSAVAQLQRYGGSDAFSVRCTCKR